MMSMSPNTAGIVTLAFLWITAAAFVFEETVIKEMFALPIASLFAFTSVRAKNYLARQQVSVCQLS
jgi:hypothetical protein